MAIWQVKGILMRKEQIEKKVKAIFEPSSITKWRECVKVHK